MFVFVKIKISVFSFRFIAINTIINIFQIWGKNENSEMANILHRPIRALTFPPTSTMGVSSFCFFLL